MKITYTCIVCGKEVTKIRTPMIGRFLKPEEVVHHIDRTKTNNIPENLMVLKSQAEHMKLHREMKKK